MPVKLPILLLCFINSFWLRIGMVYVFLLLWKVEPDFFSLGMELLNDTLEETFYLQTGDTINVDVIHISGELCISIGQKNQEPVYEGNNPELNHFRVNITNSGNYTISVIGKQAEGSISFHILRNEE